MLGGPTPHTLGSTAKLSAARVQAVAFFLTEQGLFLTPSSSSWFVVVFFARTVVSFTLSLAKLSSKKPTEAKPVVVGSR